MKPKLIITIMAGILSFVLIFALALPNINKEKHIENNFEEGAIKAKSERIVACVSNGNYQPIRDMSADFLTEVLTDNAFKEKEELKDLGNFIRTEDFAYEIGKDRNFDGPIAFANITAVYSEKNVIYKMVFDEEMKLVALFVQ